MRFLMLNWRDPLNPKSGGAERVSLAYLAALKRRGHEVWWFANEYPGCRPGDEVEGIRIGGAGGRGFDLPGVACIGRNRGLSGDRPANGLPWFAPCWCGTHCVAYIHEVQGPIWKAFYSCDQHDWAVAGAVDSEWFGTMPFWTPSESTRRALNARGIAN
jgi:hypothetical protein